MSSSSRRALLATTARAVALAALGPRWLGAQPLPAAALRSALPPTAFVPEPLVTDVLHTLATDAIDAARQAGASYADIRVGEWQRLILKAEVTDFELTFGYGVRVLVDGAWAFAHGTIPSTDAVTSAVRHAVATAKGFSRVAPYRVELAPTPVVTGEWSTPVQLDPFTVPIRDQLALINAYRAVAERVPHGSTRDGFREVDVQWYKERRVFASTEGSHTMQTLYRADPWARGVGSWGEGFGNVTLQLPHYWAASGGYEIFAAPGLQETLKQVTEEAVRLARLPRTMLDVGRYEVVFDGTTLGSAFGRTLGSAVELDRVLEYEADASGTSFLAPPNELLGTPVVSPLITASVDRTLPSITAVKWDDEGVEPKPFTVLANGVLVDYASSRETVMALKSALSQYKGSLQSYGCAVASRPDQPVIIRTPHLTIAPSATPASLDALCKNVSKGVLVRNGLYFNTDQQLASASILYGAQLFEIDKGTVVRRIDGNGLQFNTRQFWKNLQMLGDANTVQDTVIDLTKGQPWQFHKNSVTAPAGLFKDVNIISTRVRV